MNGARRRTSNHEWTRCRAGLGGHSWFLWSFVAKKQRAQAAAQKEVPSNVTVEVLGYGSK